MPEEFPDKPEQSENSEKLAEQPKERHFLEKVSEIKEAEHPESLKSHVCGYIEERYRSDRQIVMFFIDLASGGMGKGLVSHLVHKEQTQPFFDRFYDYIEKIREDVEERVGEPLHIKKDLKNDLAWLGFQETAEEIAEELGLGIGGLSSLNPLDYSDEEDGEEPAEEPSLIEKLGKLQADVFPKSIKAHVLEHVLDNCLDDEEVEVFFYDIAHSGSVSGWVPHLISHEDMVEFYDEFYDDIEEIRKRIESVTGSPLDINTRLKTFFAHLAFDETAKEIAEELGIEV